MAWSFYARELSLYVRTDTEINLCANPDQVMVEEDHFMVELTDDQGASGHVIGSYSRLIKDLVTHYKLDLTTEADRRRREFRLVKGRKPASDNE